MRIAPVIASVVLAGLLISGCSKKAAGGPGGFPPIQVIAIEATRQPVSETLSLPGTIAANEQVEVKAESDGIVQEIHFAEGERVEKGQLLVKLDETKFAATLAEVEATLRLSGANHDRAKQLFQDKLISQQDFDQTASAFAVNQASVDLMRRQLRDARVVAPFAGIVGSRQISPGQVITRNSTLTWLVDLDTVKVEVKVPERYLRQLRIGQPLEFAVAAFPGEKFRGEVYFISPQIEESTRTALVKARIANADAKLRGGMFASLDLTLQLRDAAIVIPEPALMSNGDNFSVFVVDEQGNAQVRLVEVGLRLAGKAEVVKGLNAGEKVVVEGTQKLRPGAPVKLASPEAAAPYLGS
ncbi:MAG: efflux RND transporter periplasmic adaptor subunit [Verrucomicrobia bacterium]|nr:MAG: efflux RND transporter periplasmic adaptor subunit [Verrucomicrobiota bacterium]